MNTSAHDHRNQPVLDVERLDVYRVALEFQVLVSRFDLRRQGVLRNQLERASASILANLAEGAGRRSPREKERFHAIARGSATECGALVDLVRARGLAQDDACRKAREKLVRVVQMLTKLEIRR